MGDPSSSLARITARVTLACSMLNIFAAYPGQFSPVYIETTLSLAVDASSCSWLATSLERSASRSCSGSLSTALIAAEQSELDDPEARKKKFEVIISSVATALVSRGIETPSSCTAVTLCFSECLYSCMTGQTRSAVAEPPLLCAFNGTRAAVRLSGSTL